MKTVVLGLLANKIRVFKMTKYKKILKIAYKTRKEMELLRNTTGYFESPLNLEGLCGYGAAITNERLKKQGIKSKIAEAHGHWFVISNRYIIDVTASQFNEPNIVVKKYNKRRDKNRPWYWQIIDTYNDENESDFTEIRHDIEDARKMLKAKINGGNNEQ